MKSLLFKFLFCSYLLLHFGTGNKVDGMFGLLFEEGAKKNINLRVINYK